jgi:hypothetical protein
MTNAFLPSHSVWTNRIGDLAVHLSFEPFDKASQDRRDISTLQLHFDQRKLSFHDGQVQCFTKFAWRVDLKAPSSPDLSQAGKRPVNGVVVARRGKNACNISQRLLLSSTTIGFRL